MLTSCRQLTRTLKFFSIFFRLKKYLYRFLRKRRRTLVIFRCLSVSHHIASRARLVASFLLYFLQNQRHENWRKYDEVYDCMRLACFSFEASSNTHELHQRKKKWKKLLKVRKTFHKEKEIFFATIWDAFHLDGDGTQTMTKTWEVQDVTRQMMRSVSFFIRRERRYY